MLYYIHDLDDNLQRTSPGARDAFQKAILATAAEDCGLGHAPEEIFEQAVKGAELHNDFTFFLIERYGVQWETLHFGFARRMDRSVIVPYDHLSGHFEALGDEAQHCLLTHSHFSWARDSLAINKIGPWIPEERIVSLEMYDKEMKNKGPRGFVMALDKLGGPDVKDVHFTDDSLANHVTAKKMGLRTIWTSHGRDMPAEYIPYVDQVVDNMEVFMRQQVALAKPAP